MRYPVDGSGIWTVGWYGDANQHSVLFRCARCVT